MPISKPGLTVALTLAVGVALGWTAADFFSGTEKSHDSPITSMTAAPTSRDDSRAGNQSLAPTESSPARPVLESAASQKADDVVEAVETDVSLTAPAVAGRSDASADPSPEELAERQATEQVTSVEVVSAEIEQLELELAAQSQGAPASMTTQPDEGLLAHERL